MEPGFKGNPRNKLEIFDFVYDFMLEQGCRAYCNGVCRYRHGSLCCGVGCLVPNSELTEDMKLSCGVVTNGALNPISKYLKNKGYDLTFLTQIQSVHDTSMDGAFNMTFRLAMRKLNNVYSLRSKKVGTNN